MERDNFLSRGYDAVRVRELVTKPNVSLMWENTLSNLSKLMGSSTRVLLPTKSDAVRTLFEAAIRIVDLISAIIVSSTKVG